VVIFWSPWISLARHSRSSFALVVFLCVGEELLPLSDDADEGCLWEVKPMRVELRTGIIRLRASMDGILF
jgi:hypothetical protein